MKFLNFNNMLSRRIRIGKLFEQMTFSYCGTAETNSRVIITILQIFCMCVCVHNNVVLKCFILTLRSAHLMTIVTILHHVPAKTI